MNKDDLKLVYVLKVGKNSRGEGHYEFIFSKDPSSINTDEIGWGETPASGNAEPPSLSDTHMILELKSKKIDFKCLHEMDDRPYEDGYYTIHCLAYEDRSDDANHDMLYDEMPLIVFHFSMKASEVKDIFMQRDITLREVLVEQLPVSEPDNEPEEDEDEDEEDNPYDLKF